MARHALIILTVKVKPNARTTALTRQADGSWLAAINAPPVDGKANAALLALVADHFGVPKRAVSIRTGAGSRLKRIEVAGIDALE